MATSIKKPKYIVPSMRDVRELQWNGLRVASTFCGGGGSSLGYRMAGFRVVWSSEFIESARETYIANSHTDTIVDSRDIRSVLSDDILSATGLGVGELDILDGSPPCSSFSLSGSREKGWGKTKQYSDKSQRTDDLFFEYARILKGLQPKVFIAENVAGLVVGTAKGYFIEILQRLRSCGYRVSCRVLDAQWLGVPQSRKRAIFIGIRDDIGLDPVFPDPKPWRYSLSDAFASQPVMSNVDGCESIERFAIGAEWRRLSQGQQSDKYFNLIRSDMRCPSPTITATGRIVGAASATHPTECRKFTIGELKRICSFPDDFIVSGTYSQQYERLGRAVPPLMMKAIAETVRDRILVV